MGASPDTTARDRERLRRVIERVPDEDVPTLLRVADALAHYEVSVSPDEAPLDDEGDLTDEMIARLAEADQAIAEGGVMSDEELRRRLNL
jgi:hypothetical protein